MREAVLAALHHLASTSPAGAIAAAVLVGLALVVVIFASISGMLSDRRAAKQMTAFQDQLLAAIKVLTESEAELRAENAGLRDDLGRFGATIELLRNQNRRVIELLRDVVEGRVAVGAVTIPEAEGEA